MNNLSRWPTTTIKGSSYLKGRIGWQGLKASEFTDHGPFLITGTDFVGGRIEWGTCYHVTEERFREAEYIHVRNGDLLITKDGTIGKVAYVVDCPPKAVLNSGIFLLRCSDGSYEHRYLYQLLKSHIFDKFLRVYLAGSTINHLYQNVFERFNFPIPNIRVQRRIAEILSTLDDAIEQTEALIAKHQQIKVGLMHDLFTRGVTPHGHLRPTREQAPDLYKESPLGWIPREWGFAALQEIVNPNRPIVYGILMPGYGCDGGVPVVKVKDIRGGTIDESELLLTSPQIDQEYRRSRLQPGDILLTIRGSVGRLAVVPSSLAEANITQDTARISIQNGNAQFYRYFLETNAARRHFEINTLGVAVQGINLGEVRKTIVPVADLQEQDRIANRIDDCVRRILCEQMLLEKLRKKKVGLMHDLLTGRVRVPITEQ